MRGERALGLDRRVGRVLGAREREEERVALRVDLGAAASLHGAAHDPPVVVHDLRVVVAELLQQPRRALDVAEEEGDRSAGKRAHRPQE